MSEEIKQNFEEISKTVQKKPVSKDLKKALQENLMKRKAALKNREDSE